MLPSGASAAGCAPQTFTLSDRPDDGLYLSAPEITSVIVTVDADCNLRFEDTFSNRSGAMGPSDVLQWSIDADNNLGTGRGTGPLKGTDMGLSMTPDGQVRVLDVAGQVITTLPAAGPFAASVPAATLGLTETSTFRVQAASFYFLSGRPGYFDLAPNEGDPPFVVQLTPAAAAVAPPSTPATPTPLPPVTAPVAQCVVPKLAGLTVRAARIALTKANCALGAVHTRRARGKAGLILLSSPKAGTTTTAGRKVAVTVRAHRR